MCDDNEPQKHIHEILLYCLQIKNSSFDHNKMGNILESTSL